MDFITTNYKMILGLLGFIASCVATGVMFFLSKTFAKREELAKVILDMSQLKTKVDSLPSVQQLHALQLEISDLRGDLKKLDPQLNSVSRLSDLLLESRLGENK